jgi:hypothetical protein
LAVQVKDEQEPITFLPDHAVFFLTFFHPQKPPTPESHESPAPYPIQYLGAFLLDRPPAVGALFPTVAKILQFPEDTRFIAFDIAEEIPRMLSDTDSLSNPPKEAFHFIFQLPMNVEMPPTEFKWEVPIPSDSKPITLRTVKYGYPKTIEQFLEPGIKANVFQFDEIETPLFEASFPIGIRLDDFKQFLVKEIDGEEDDPLKDSITIYNNIPESEVRATVPMEEYREYGLTPYFSSIATLKYRIWVQRNRGIPEERYRSSQQFMIVYQNAVGAATERHHIFTPQNPTVGDVVDQLVRDRVLSDPNVVVHRVLNYLIESRLNNEQRLFRGDNVVFITTEHALESNEGEKVIRAVHAVKENDLFRPYGDPFFFTVILSDTCDDALEKFQKIFNPEDEESAKFSLILVTQKGRSIQRTVIQGKGTIADALAAQSAVTDPYLYVLHEKENKGADSGSTSASRSNDD